MTMWRNYIFICLQMYSPQCKTLCKQDLQISYLHEKLHNNTSIQLKFLGRKHFPLFGCLDQTRTKRNPNLGLHVGYLK